MKAQLVYENINFERGRDPKDTLQIGVSAKLKKVIPRIIDRIYMDHERDLEYIENELEGDELEEFEDMVERGGLEKYYYPMEYNLEDAEREGLEDSFNLILQYPELSEPLAKEYVKKEDDFSGVKIKDDHILTWWGKEDGPEFPY